MADDVTYTVAANATPPGGTKATTDETASGPHSVGSHMGIAKLAVSADGDSTHVPATVADGLLVEVSNLAPGPGGGSEVEIIGPAGEGPVQVYNNDGGDAVGGGFSTLSTRAQLALFNGATWDRARGTITDGLLVDISNASLAVTGTVTAVKDLGATGTTTQVADNAASVTILAANAGRFSFSVTNDSSATLYLKLAASAASLTDYTVQVPTNSFFSDDTYAGEVRGIWASDPGDGAARVTEVT